NLESPIAPLGHAYEPTGSFVFSTPPVAADELMRTGSDVVSSTSFPAWAPGIAGVLETLVQLDRVGVAHAGTGHTVAAAHRPVILERKGWRVAFFAMTRAFNPAPTHFYTHLGSHYIAYADSGRLYPAIRQVKATHAADLVVVSVHAGQELSPEPDAALRQFFRGAVDA